MPFELSSSAFRSGEAVPLRHSCSGKDISPPFKWSGVPPATQSLALICEDPDAPGGTFYHWGVYNLPSRVNSLAEGVDAESIGDGATTVRNSFGSTDYRGPCPPKGHGVHHYHFRLFALSVPGLQLGANPDCRGLVAAVRAHVVASTELVGTFAR
jgi:Raf kinase inhibitor-like YbhB/YbcL family protein